MIGVVDYGMGNLLSVLKAFERVGRPARIVRTARELNTSDKLVLPGVGAFGQAMENLAQRGLLAPLRDAIADRTPLLGICLGLQLLFDRSEEHGNHEGLGLLRGDVTRLPSTVKVPHIGWNQLAIVRKSPLLDGIPDDAFFYFVQSFYVRPENVACVVGATDYGLPFASVVEEDHIFGVQFHPEKSQQVGLRLLANFGGL